MKSVLVAMVLLATSAFAGQDMQLPSIDKEMQKVNFMLGSWRGTEKMPGMGGANAKASMVGKKMLDDRYYHTTHVMDMGKAGKMQGLHLLSYDPFKKHYVAFWFDSTAPGVMEMSGNFQGNKLVMVSKPTEIPGMPAPLVMRATWTKVSNSKVDFLLQAKEGDKWAPMIQGSFRKTG